MKATVHYLVVDDNEADRFLNHRLLRKIGIAEECTHEAVDGQEALDQLEGPLSDFDCVILLDINMPVMNGFEFLQHLDPAETAGKREVLIITSSQDSGDREKAKDFDTVTGYLTKPLEPSSFCETLEGLAINM